MTVSFYGNQCQGFPQTIVFLSLSYIELEMKVQGIGNYTGGQYVVFSTDLQRHFSVTKFSCHLGRTGRCASSGVFAHLVCALLVNQG